MFADCYATVNHPQLLFCVRLIHGTLVILFLFMFGSDVSSLVCNWVVSSCLTLLVSTVIITGVSSCQFVSRVGRVAPPVLLDFIVTVTVCFINDVPASAVVVFLLRVIINVIICFKLTVLFQVRVVTSIGRVVGGG